jgi:Asp/Glu/hydantoin racemase
MASTLAFIHTSHVLIPTFTDLARKYLIGVKVFHMVDESLIQNTITSGGLTKTTTRRLGNMIGSAHDGGADAVMVTCSSIGPAVPAARTIHDFPIFRIDDAMATKAVQTAARIGVDRIVSEALTSFIGKIDVLVLAQASMARVVNRLPAGTLDIPVLSSPELAIQQARELVFS